MTPIALGLTALVATGCDDDKTCGPGDAPFYGLVASGAGVEITYGSLRSGRNHDCTPTDAPEGVISLTLEGTQMNAARVIAFCVPRPDLLDEGVVMGDGFRIPTLYGEAGGCTFELQGAVPTGTARATGICEDGVDPAGYALTLDGSVELERTCGSVTDVVSFDLTGTVSVRLWDQ